MNMDSYVKNGKWVPREILIGKLNEVLPEDNFNEIYSLLTSVYELHDDETITPRALIKLILNKYGCRSVSDVIEAIEEVYDIF